VEGKSIVKVVVITISDRASRGEYEDASGPEIAKEVRNRFADAAVTRRIVPDEQPRILAALEESSGVDFILTTGGTGISPRDVTPEATRRFVEKELPGISECLRAQSYAETPSAMLSRGVAGIKGSTIVVNFPGSLSAVRLCMRVLGPVMEHALRMQRGEGHG
jgi:molybdopterin adenylyltransferase